MDRASQIKRLLRLGRAVARARRNPSTGGLVDLREEGQATLRSRARHLHDQAAEFATTGRDDEAVMLYRQALDLKRRALPPADPELVPTLHNLALLYQSLGRTDEAQELRAEARRIVDGPAVVPLITPHRSSEYS